MTKKRKLKVYEGSGRHYKVIPKILLQGLWLEQFGFSIGANITVECSQNKIAIMKEELVVNDDTPLYPLP